MTQGDARSALLRPSHHRETSAMISNLSVKNAPVPLVVSWRNQLNRLIRTTGPHSDGSNLNLTTFNSIVKNGFRDILNHGTDLKFFTPIPNMKNEYFQICNDEDLSLALELGFIMMLKSDDDLSSYIVPLYDDQILKRSITYEKMAEIQNYGKHSVLKKRDDLNNIIRGIKQHENPEKIPISSSSSDSEEVSVMSYRNVSHSQKSISKENNQNKNQQYPVTEALHPNTNQEQHITREQINFQQVDQTNSTFGQMVPNLSGDNTKITDNSFNFVNKNSDQSQNMHQSQPDPNYVRGQGPNLDFQNTNREKSGIQYQDINENHQRNMILPQNAPKNNNMPSTHETHKNMPSPKGYEQVSHKSGFSSQQNQNFARVEDDDDLPPSIDQVNQMRSKTNPHQQKNPNPFVYEQQQQQPAFFPPPPQPPHFSSHQNLMPPQFHELKHPSTFGMPGPSQQNSSIPDPNNNQRNQNIARDAFNYFGDQNF